MKFKNLLLLVFFLAGNVHAQVAQWLIPASYNKLEIDNEMGLIITDSINKKVIWDFDGRRLADTSDELFSFSNDIAVTIKPETNNVTGFINKDGKYTKINEYQIAYGHPYFSDGYLLVLEDNYFRFIDKKGNFTNSKYVKAFPYSNGYAACYTYKDWGRWKKPSFFLIKDDSSRVPFTFNGKPIDDDDIEFVSSVNDEGIAVVVAKQKLYLFNGNDMSLSAVFANDTETNLRNQAKLEQEIPTSAFLERKGKLRLEAYCGKTDKVVFSFNQFFVPESITINGKETIYKKKETTAQLYESPLRISKEGDKQGLIISTDYTEVLPPQFEDILVCIDDKAIVKLSGKYGMVKVIKDKTFRLSMNKGNDIPFRHRKYETVVRADLPVEISSENTRIEIDPKTGCEIDMTSKEYRDTESGNFVQYNCVLNIPSDLSDSISEISYPVQVLYDGLISPVIPFMVKGWHYKYFYVDAVDSETTVSDGTFSFTFNIVADRSIGEDVYPWDVTINADTLKTEIERLSETRYKCKIYSLNEGANNIIINVTEQGCPPVPFPYVVTYTKPIRRVVIKKKTEDKPLPI